MSTQRQKQDAAIAVFRELGWEGARAADVMGLPLGTLEQRKLAREGLERGEWEGFLPDPTDPEAGGDWGNFWGLDSSVLRFFALRVGVSPRRAVRVMAEHTRAWADPEVTGVLRAVLLERGPAFAERFIDAAAANEFGWIELAEASIAAVHELSLPVPEGARYLESYAEHLSFLFQRELERADPDPNATWDPPLPFFRERFSEHAAEGIPAASATSRVWAEALAGAHAHGWLSREAALDFVWTGMDAAQRPAARGPWVKALSGPLAVSDAELDAARDRLIPLLSLGHGPTVELVAPRLLANSNDEQAVELAYASLGAGTQKAKVAVLKALAARPAPQGEARAELLGLVGPLLEGTPTEAKAAAAVLAVWGAEDAVTHAPSGAQAARGLWHAVPAVWKVQRFEVGKANADAVRELARSLEVGDANGATIEAEDLLARTHALAWADPQAAEEVLLEGREWWFGGLDPELWSGAPHAARIRADARKRWGDDWEDWGTSREENDGWTGLIERRQDSLSRWLGSGPVLLSTPSSEDLVVEVDDLLERLGALAEAGVPALEDDLLLALTRLRGTAAGPLELSAGQARVLAAGDVRVRRWDGSFLKHDAAWLVGAYLAAPLREPKARGFRLDLTAGVEGFRTRVLRGGSAGVEGPAVFPEWGEGGLSADPMLAPEEWRQLTARRGLLPEGLATALLAALAAAPADPVLVEAASLAWERGVLPPSCVRPAALKGPFSFGAGGARAVLAGTGDAAEVLASAGGASAGWALLAGVIELWADVTRPPKGLLGVIETLGELAPEALLAVENGLAGLDVLSLPGLRALAARGGSSAVVGAARRVAALIPVADDPEDPPVPFGAGAASAPGAPGGTGAPGGSAKAKPGASGTAASASSPTVVPREEDFAAAWGPSAEAFTGTAASAAAAPAADGSTLFFEGEPGESRVILLLEASEGTGGKQVGLSWEAPDWRLGRLEPERGADGRSYLELVGSEWQGDGLPGRDMWLRFTPEGGYVAKPWDDGHPAEGNAEENPDADDFQLPGSPFGDEDFDVYWARQQANPPEPVPLPAGLAGLQLSLACADGAAERSVRTELAEAAQAGWLTSAVVAAHLPAVLRGAHPNGPSRLATLLEQPGTLGALWPVLTESVALAAELEGTPPRWLAPVLRVAIAKAPVLKEAARRGLMPADWPGLDTLAAWPGKSTALAAARTLKESLS